jgi:hypothetical protein
MNLKSCFTVAETPDNLRAGATRSPSTPITTIDPGLPID